MIRELDDIIFFDNDDEFYNFVLVPVVKVSIDNTGDQPRSINELTTNWEYNLALKNNKKFIIRDEDSQIYKHGCVSYRTVNKYIDNLEPYYKGITERDYDPEGKVFTI